MIKRKRNGKQNFKINSKQLLKASMIPLLTTSFCLGGLSDSQRKPAFAIKTTHRLLGAAFPGTFGEVRQMVLLTGDPLGPGAPLSP